MAWTSPCTCTRTLSHRENMHLCMGMKAETLYGVHGQRGEFLTWAYMAKWAVGEVSGAPEFPLGIDQIGMAGVRTIKVDGVRGLLRLVRRSVDSYLRDDRSSLAGG